MMMLEAKQAYKLCAPCTQTHSNTYTRARMYENTRQLVSQFNVSIVAAAAAYFYQQTGENARTYELEQQLTRDILSRLRVEHVKCVY